MANQKGKPRTPKAKLITALHCSDKYRTVYRYEKDAYRDLIRRYYGVASSKDMSPRQLVNLLDYFNGKTAAPTRMIETGAGAGNVTAMISPKLKAKILALSKLIRWREHDGFARWMGARYKGGRIKTAKQAAETIEALKAMFERQMADEHGADWKGKTYDNDGINTYIRLHC